MSFIHGRYALYFVTHRLKVSIKAVWISRMVNFLQVLDLEPVTDAPPGH